MERAEHSHPPGTASIDIPWVREQLGLGPCSFWPDGLHLLEGMYRDVEGVTHTGPTAWEGGTLIGKACDCGHTVVLPSELERIARLRKAATAGNY